MKKLRLLETLHNKFLQNLWLLILILLAFPLALYIGVSGYDAPIHMFFGDHYAKSWFSFWDYRWYNGFNVASYPPLIHQLLALFELILREPTLCYALISSISIIFYAYALARYGKLFLEYNISILASIATILTPATMISFLFYGHLTTIFSTALAFLSSTFFIEYIKNHNYIKLVISSLLASASIYSHHLTSMIFLPILYATTIIQTCLNHRAIYKKILKEVFRLLFLIVLFSIGIYPFIEFTLNAPIQTEIPHWSRYPFNSGYLNLTVCYSFTTYSLVILSIIIMIIKGKKTKTLIPLISAAIFLTFLSMGLSTPLPQIIFQGYSKWLTYERFAFWATPLAIITFSKAIMSNPRKFSIPWTLILLIALIGIIAVSAILYLRTRTIMYGYKPTYLPFSIPEDKCIQAVAKFLDQNCGDSYRYLTLGFSTKASIISILSNAKTIDGFYPTARSDPLLTQSGIESLDSIIHWSNGLKILNAILSKADFYGLKYIIVREHDNVYSAILKAYGYKQNNQIYDASIWINENINFIELKKQNENLEITSILWGVMPLITFMTSLVLMIIDAFKK
jgi:hypothetical protein